LIFWQSCNLNFILSLIIICLIPSYQANMLNQFSIDMKKVLVLIAAIAMNFSVALTPAKASCDGVFIYLCWSDFEEFVEDYNQNCQPGDVVYLEMLDC